MIYQDGSDEAFRENVVNKIESEIIVELRKVVIPFYVCPKVPSRMVTEGEASSEWTTSEDEAPELNTLVKCKMLSSIEKSRNAVKF